MTRLRDDGGSDHDLNRCIREVRLACNHVQVVRTPEAQEKIFAETLGREHQSPTADKIARLERELASEKADNAELRRTVAIRTRPRPNLT